MRSWASLPEGLRDEIEIQLARQRAAEIQRVEQQGLGSPILSVEHTESGHRIVAVGRRLFSSKKWSTFHEFLSAYMMMVLGTGWGKAEQRKPFDQRHPVLQWNHLVAEQTRGTSSRVGEEIHYTPMTGAAAAYFQLAYDLYTLEHNMEVQKRLVRRLRHPDLFQGAYYEAFVAATFVRAGYDIEFENESDGTTTHCEFTATSRVSGRKFSVEAKSKRRSGPLAADSIDPQRLNFDFLLRDALRKRALHDRVIFVDLNVPTTSGDGVERILRPARERLHWLADNLRLPGDLCAPPAYVFLTAYPHQHNLRGSSYGRGFLVEGFRIEDWKDRFHTVAEARLSRENHREIWELAKFMHAHTEVPSTFDGSNPFLRRAKTSIPPLQIGRTYSVPIADGSERSGTLYDVVVLGAEKKAFGALRDENGLSFLATFQMTDDELDAYNAHPDTFFGIHRPRPPQAENALDFYDFFYETYSKSSKENLLKFMRDHPDYEKLSEMDQEELAIFYSERLAYAAEASRKRGAPSPDTNGRPE